MFIVNGVFFVLLKHERSCLFVLSMYLLWVLLISHFNSSPIFVTECEFETLAALTFLSADTTACAWFLLHIVNKWAFYQFFLSSPMSIFLVDIWFVEAICSENYSFVFFLSAFFISFFALCCPRAILDTWGHATLSMRDIVISFVGLAFTAHSTIQIAPHFIPCVKSSCVRSGVSLRCWAWSVGYSRSILF